MNPLVLKIIEAISSQLKHGEHVDDCRTPCGSYEFLTSSFKDPLHFWELVFALLYPTDDTLEYEVSEQTFLHSQNPGSPQELASVKSFRFTFTNSSLSFYGNGSSSIAKFNQCYHVTLKTMDVKAGKTIQMSRNGLLIGRTYRVLKDFNFNALCEEFKKKDLLRSKESFIEQALTAGYLAEPEGEITISERTTNFSMYLVATIDSGSAAVKV
jgi:hypothetical protein